MLKQSSISARASVIDRVYAEHLILTHFDIRELPTQAPPIFISFIKSSPKMSSHPVAYLILFIFVLIDPMNCVPAGPSQRPKTPKVKQIQGKSIQSVQDVSDSKISGNKMLKNSTDESSLKFKGFSWSSMEDIVRQVVVASNAVDHLEKMKTKLLSQFALSYVAGDKKAGEFATARGGYGGYGAYGFPSLEGALLSIAFLTFSVFLIDLIQQLLSRFRTGTAGVVPLVGRRRRSLVPEDEYDPMLGLTKSVLNSIDHPVFKM